MLRVIRLRTRTPLVVFLAALLVLASLQGVFASEWVKYDDGESDERRSTTAGRQLLVEFSFALYYMKYRIIAISFYVYDSTPFRAHVFKPGISCADLFVSDITPTEIGGGRWIDVVMPTEIIVTGHGSDLDAFFVSIEYLTNNRPEIGFDTDRWEIEGKWNPDRFRFRSYEGKPSRDWNCAYEANMLAGDLMIRALVEESGSVTILGKEAANTTTTQQWTTTSLTEQQFTTVSAQQTTATTQYRTEASGVGLSFAVIAIGAGVAAAAGGLALAIGQPRSEVYAYAGRYYCRRHRTPVWSVDGRLWCPIERRFLRS